MLGWLKFRQTLSFNATHYAAFLGSVTGLEPVIRAFYFV